MQFLNSLKSCTVIQDFITHTGHWSLWKSTVVHFGLFKVEDLSIWALWILDCQGDCLTCSVNFLHILFASHIHVMPTWICKHLGRLCTKVQIALHVAYRQPSRDNNKVINIIIGSSWLTLTVKYNFRSWYVGYLFTSYNLIFYSYYLYL